MTVVPLASAIGDQVYQLSGTVGGDLAWYDFDVSDGNVSFASSDSFFAGWTSPDWLERRGDTTDPDSRTLQNPFGTVWDDPADPFPSGNYDALIRVTVTPEPGTCALAVMAVGFAAAYVRRRRAGSRTEPPA